MLDGLERALVLAPHTDDGEFGCGGTMARLVEAGCEVRYVAFSIATRSLPPGFEPDTLAREVREATGELGRADIEDYLDVPDVVGGEDGDYILRVRGDSMKDAGILEGDFVVVRPTERARDGEIVVALVGDEATVKRFFREKDQIRLQPENKSLKPIRTRDLRLLGRVVGVFRRVS